MIKLKILGLTDLHTGGIIPLEDIRKVVEDEKIDLIILAGDLTTFGSSDLVKKVLEEFALLERTIFYIPGNMDSVNSGSFEFSRVKPLHARVVYYQGINFLGLGASNPTPFNTPFELSEEELCEVLETAQERARPNVHNILVCHAPPYSTLDDIGGANVGCRCFRDHLNDFDLVCCGHIHDHTGVMEVDGTKVVNPGPASEGKCALITLGSEAKEIEVEFVTLS